MPKQRKTPTKISDMGTPELRQHHTIIKEYVDEHTVQARNATQRPIDRYLSYKSISQEQWEAGDRVYRDFIHAGLLPKTTPDYSNVVKSKGKPSTSTEKQLEAREQFHKVLDCLEQEGRQLVWNVCCLGHPCSEQGMARKYAIARLRSALEELSYYFKFILPGEKK